MCICSLSFHNFLSIPFPRGKVFCQCGHRPQQFLLRSNCIDIVQIRREFSTFTCVPNKYWMKWLQRKLNCVFIAKRPKNQKTPKSTLCQSTRFFFPSISFFHFFIFLFSFFYFFLCPFFSSFFLLIFLPLFLFSSFSFFLSSIFLSFFLFFLPLPYLSTRWRFFLL